MAPLPVLETERLVLREVTVADVTDYAKHFVDYEVVRYLSTVVPWPLDGNSVREFLETQVMPEQGISRWMWGLHLKEAPSGVIGAIDLWREGRPAHRGFWLARKFWRQGLMTEAVEPVMDYAFDVLGFERLVFSNAVGNVASRRVKEKTGARFLRIEPARHVDPSLTQREIWELTREEWQRHRCPPPDRTNSEA